MPVSQRSYEIRYHEWGLISAALEREFPKIRWTSGQRLSEASPWGLRPEENKDIVVGLLEVAVSGKPAFTWRQMEEEEPDIVTFVNVDKYRPRITNKLHELEF
jgi:hypothetical protein